MRRFALAITLTMASCAAPQRQPEAVAPPPVVQAPQPLERGPVIGMTAAELVSHFGNPALQIHEGNSVKLQFRAPGCVLDAYLYPPPGGGAQRVTHVDARLSSGADTDAQRCASELARGS